MGVRGGKEGREGGKEEEREGGKQGSGEILGSDFSVLVPTGTVVLTYYLLLSHFSRVRLCVTP